MRITINGDLGSGKSTVGRLLANRLGIPYVSTGQIFREIGRIKNLDALRTNLAAEDNSEIDAQVDEEIARMDRDEQSFVLDSRMAWHFIHEATSVYLSITPETAAARIFADTTRSTESYSSMQNAVASLGSRRSSEVSRYKRLYGVDIENPKNYQLHIITDDAHSEAVADLIYRYATGSVISTRWLPKVRVVPVMGIREAAGLSPPGSYQREEPLPLEIEKNFGFAFGPAQRFIDCMHFGHEFVPYQIERPSFLGKGSVLELALQTVRQSDLYDWEEITGTKFSFDKMIASATPAD